MAFAAKILADSISPDGVRLTTFEITFPRIILSEFNTHRVFSRNSASSRAIPAEKMIKMVRESPYIPTHWGKNQKGMQADQEVSEAEAFAAAATWKVAILSAIDCAEELHGRGIHKQITNRLLEPFMWHTVIVTATEWDNFFHLRNNPQAHPDIQTIARMMQELYEGKAKCPDCKGRGWFVGECHPQEECGECGGSGRTAEPIVLRFGEWHTPLIDLDTSAEVFSQWRAGKNRDAHDTLCKISVARCARVSYLTHDGKRDIQADLDLHDRLLSSGHLSPFEHVARPEEPEDRAHRSLGIDRRKGDGWYGNFRGWLPYRKLIPNEHDILGGAK